MRKLSGLETELAPNEPSNREVWQKVTNGYFAQRSFEREGRVYEWLGVKTFKKIYVGFTNKHLNISILKGGDKKSLVDCINTTKWFEAAHLLFTAIMIPLIASNLVNSNYKISAFSGVGNILVNIYPIMLQRYNRIRLYNAIERIDKRIQK